MSVADQIEQYLKSQLALIRAGAQLTLFTGQVYTMQTDAGALVDTNLEYTEHPDDMPSLVYYTGKNTTFLDDSIELGMEGHQQEFSVEGFIECDKGGTEADALKNDLSCALKANPWWGGLIDRMDNFESDVSIQVGDTVFAIVKVSAIAIYAVPFGSE